MSLESSIVSAATAFATGIILISSSSLIYSITITQGKSGEQSCSEGITVVTKPAQAVLFKP